MENAGKLCLEKPCKTGYPDNVKLRLEKAYHFLGISTIAFMADNIISKLTFRIIIIIALFPFFAIGLAQEGEPEEIAETASPLRVVFFYSPSCGSCDEERKVLSETADIWADYIIVEEKKTDTEVVFEELLLFEKHYGAKIDEPAVIFVGDQYLAGKKAILNQLDDVIAQELAKGSITFVPADLDGGIPSANEKDLPSVIINRFHSFTVGTIAIAGLLDGINPCAFTTIIFFLSMLTYLGKSKQQLAAVGIGFTAAVFVTYFLLGLGLLGAIKTFSVSRGISTWVTYVVAFLAFFLAGWSLLDAIRYIKTKSTKNVTLGLPNSIKTKIHNVIRIGLTTRGLVIGSVGIGFLVALLESVCTGQVYLPTIIFVARSPGLRTGAIGYLLFYNLMFIIPLVVILVIAYFGVKSEACFVNGVVAVFHPNCFLP